MTSVVTSKMHTNSASNIQAPTSFGSYSAPSSRILLRKDNGYEYTLKPSDSVNERVLKIKMAAKRNGTGAEKGYRLALGYRERQLQQSTKTNKTWLNSRIGG